MSGFPLDSSAIFKNDERKSLISTQLYREIRDQGYTGSRPLVGLLIYAERFLLLKTRLGLGCAEALPALIRR